MQYSRTPRRPKSVSLIAHTNYQAELGLPNSQIICKCEMCSNYDNKIMDALQKQRSQQINRIISQKVKYKHGLISSNYLWMIKHLSIPQNKIIKMGLDIYITETLFFTEGEPNKLYCIKQLNEPIIKVVLKQKLSTTLILRMFSDRRKKYRETINNYLGKKKEVVVKKLYGQKKQPKRQSKDGVIIKFNDALEQLISENQFLFLLQRRKQDPIWRQIYYIKNYISVEDILQRTFVTKFTDVQIKDQQMYKRAKTLMKVYALNILEGDRNFISETEQKQFCSTILSNSMSIYCEYLLYKIVCFIQYFHDERIREVEAKFIINQMGHAYLDDVISLKTQSLTKFQWTNETYLKKINEEQQRVFFSKQVRADEKIHSRASQIQKLMSRTYERMKQSYGLSKQQQDDQQQRSNNNFFKLIHPEIEEPINSILKMSGMTVERFKKDYLGYKPQKKPIVKPFNSNLIRSLHNITSQFHQAPPHQFVKQPYFSTNRALCRPRSEGRSQGPFFSRNSKTALSTPRAPSKQRAI